MSDTYFETNAIIRGTDICIEDHGHLTAYLHLEYDGSGQSFGGYALDNQFAAVFLRKVMETLEVTNWDDVKGKAIRVKADNSHVYAIGHFIKDKWFAPSATLLGEE